MRGLVTTVGLVVAIAGSGACAVGCSRPRPDAIVRDDASAAADDAIVVALAESGDPVTVQGRPVATGTLVTAFRGARAGTVRIEAPAQTNWRQVIGVLDQVKQAGGDRAFVLGITGDGARRSNEVHLPKAMRNAPPVAGADGAADGVESVTLVSVMKDATVMLNGAASTGDLATALAKVSPPIRDHLVVLEADADAPYGVVVDAILIAQRQGARVAFGVRMSPVPAAPK